MKRKKLKIYYYVDICFYLLPFILLFIVGFRSGFAANELLAGVNELFGFEFLDSVFNDLVNIISSNLGVSNDVTLSISFVISYFGYVFLYEIISLVFYCLTFVFRFLKDKFGGDL